MSHHPMPVPPIYQPEIPAKFIVDAALDGRRDKIVGSWNKMLVMIASLMPGLGNQYAAIGAWDAQLTSQEVDPNRPVNLYEPADADTDHGAHGSFDAQAGGFLDPSFLKSVPNTVKTFCQALAHTAQDKKRVRRNRKRHGLNPSGVGPAERPLYALRAKSSTTETPAPTL